jgi:hypothetical protein
MVIFIFKIDYMSMNISYEYMNFYMKHIPQAMVNGNLI